MSNLRLKDHTWDAANVYDSALGTTQDQINAELAGKQETLVSGMNIKTINGASILGSGNIEIQGGGGSVTVDDTLSTAGAAADAKAAGDALRDLEAQVEDVRESLIGMKSIEFQPGYYYFSNRIGGCEIVPREAQTYVCALCPCSEGDVFTVNIYSGIGHQRGYAFLDEELTPYGISDTDQLIENKKITAPANAMYLIVNNKLENLPTGYYLHKGQPVVERVDEIEEAVSKKADALTIPAYYNENNYLGDKINTIMERSLSITGDSFVFVTDYHAHKNTGHTPALVNKIYEQTGISKLFCGGDLGTSTGISGMKTNAKAFKALWECAPGFYTCTGNHEWKVSDSSTPTANYSSVYNYYIGQMDQRVSEMSDFGDFWVDSKGAKIRYFFINQTILAEITNISLKWFVQQLPDVPAGYGIVVITHNAYHNKTYDLGRDKLGNLEWDENALGIRNVNVRRITQILNAIKTGTTVKYALLPRNNSEDRSSDLTPRESSDNCGDYDPIASTFAVGTNTGSYTDIVTFDGTSVKTGVYPIAIFCGHKHEDGGCDPASAASLSDMTDTNTMYLLDNTWYRYDSENTQWTAMLAAPGAESLTQIETMPPILTILTTTDCYQLKDAADETVRKVGTTTEQAFDVVQIDTVGRKIYCTRIGGGSDRVFSF